MSIVRVGLAETRNFSEGYERIFGKKQEQEPKKDEKNENRPAEEKEQQKK